MRKNVYDLVDFFGNLFKYGEPNTSDFLEVEFPRIDDNIRFHLFKNFPYRHKKKRSSSSSGLIACKITAQSYDKRILTTKGITRVCLWAQEQ